MRALAALLLGVLFLTMTAHAQVEWVQLDDPPKERAGDGEAPVDMVDLFYAANATHILFREDLVALPDVGNYTYTVYLDKPQGQEYEQDFRLVHSQSGSYIEQWNGTDWVYLEDLVVTVDAGNVSLIFEVSVDTLGGVGDSNIKVWFENYPGEDTFTDPDDRAPNGGGFVIHRRAIPNLPLIVVPAFLAALGGSVYLLRKRLLPA